MKAHLSGDNLSFLVYPLHGGRGEIRQDEAKGANKVAWELVDERQLLKDNGRRVEAHQKNYWRERERERKTERERERESEKEMDREREQITYIPA